MRYLLRLFSRTFGISTSVMTAYRSNVLFFFVFESMFLVAQFVTVSVGFDLTGGGEIAGWTRKEVYFLTAINGLSHQLFICFFIGPIFNVGMQVWNGQYDYILLKPLHPLLSMWFYGQFVISNLPNLAINLVIVGGLLWSSGVPISAMQLAGFILFVGTGLGVRVGIALISVAPAFIAERLADSEDTFWPVVSLGRFPLAVFPRGVETLLTFLIPIGMLASIPAGFIFGKVSVSVMAGAFAASLVFMALAVGLFILGLRRYQSVNSGM